MKRMSKESRELFFVVLSAILISVLFLIFFFVIYFNTTHYDISMKPVKGSKEAVVVSSELKKEIRLVPKQKYGILPTGETGYTTVVDREVKYYTELTVEYDGKQITMNVSEDAEVGQIVYVREY